MSDKSHPKTRALKIILVVGAMGSVVWAVGERLRNGQDSAAHAPLHHSVLERIEHSTHPKPIPHAPGPNQHADASQRNLAQAYDLRAYSGAPPMIPHKLETTSIGGSSCTTCHERGGYIEKFKTYAPVTPHPQYESCTQCHVPQTQDGLFRESEWASVKPPQIKRPALPGSPPPIPHTLQLRDNCIACHGGPSAPLEVRTSHPERENCIQCHVPQTTPSIFERSVQAWMTPATHAPEGLDY